MVRRMNAPLVVDALRERHELYQSELTRLGNVWVLRGVKHRLSMEEEEEEERGERGIMRVKQEHSSMQFSRVIYRV